MPETVDLHIKNSISEKKEAEIKKNIYTLNQTRKYIYFMPYLYVLYSPIVFIPRTKLSKIHFSPKFKVTSISKNIKSPDFNSYGTS